MAEKDPERWDEKIISTPFATLTKRDVYEYYSDPAVKNRILRAANGGETVVRQSFAPGRDVLRRKDPAGNLIRMTSKKYDELKNIRMSEVHPTFGRRVDFLLADVDPKGKVPWQKTKAIAETIAKTMQTQPDVRDVNVRFSGGRGFYVQGRLGKATDVDAARRKTRKVLDGVARHPDVTFGVPRSGQIRIDTTPLKHRGSVRAPYSLDARTGLVSVPVSLSKLPKVQKSDFTVNKALKEVKKQAADISKKKMLERQKKMNVPTTTLPEAPKKVWERSQEAAGKLFKPITVMEPEKVKKAAEIMRPLSREGFYTHWINDDIIDLPPKARKRLELIREAAMLSPERPMDIPQFTGEWKNNIHYTREHPAYIEWKKKVRSAADYQAKLQDIARRAEELGGSTLRKSILQRYDVPAGPTLGKSHPVMFPKKAEFAPGIPSKTTKAIPEVENQPWMMSIQKHDAHKAGTHYDLRLVDPKTDQAHSFAIPKARLPHRRDRMLLAMQQPTHTADYALNFEGEIPEGTYGAGRVTMPFKEPIDVIRSNADKIHFVRKNGQRYVLFRSGREGPRWGFKRLK